MKSLPAILMYLCIPLIGNGVYFLTFYEDGSPSCGLLCLLFFNISFLCLFLPFLSSKVKDSSYLKGGENLFCVWYFIIETIIAFLFILKEGSPTAALVTQMLLLGLFMILFFRISSANQNTHRSLTEFNNTRSQDLLQARINLQMALNHSGDINHKERIRSLIAEINSSPVHTKPETAGIERLINEKSSYISTDSQLHHFEEISQLINQRKTLFSINN